MNIGQAIRESRLSRNLSQQEVGDLAGVSRQAVGLLEANGGRMLTLAAVAPHAPFKVYGLSAGDTIGARVTGTRIRTGLSQSALAAAADVSVNTVRAVEADGGTLSSFCRIASALAPRARAEPWLDRKPSEFKTVHGKPNPDRDFSDHYTTPAPIVRLLLDNESFSKADSVLEPCVGTARVIETVLRESGFENITCFDLLGSGHERRDFFDITERYTAIITNPPFNRHLDFILHAKRVALDKVALLLPLNYLTGAKRHGEVWADTNFPLARVLILNRGVSSLSEDPFASRLSSSQLYCAWFIFYRNHVRSPEMRWIDNHSLIDRQRVRVIELGVRET